MCKIRDSSHSCECVLRLLALQTEFWNEWNLSFWPRPNVALSNFSSERPLMRRRPAWRRAWRMNDLFASLTSAAGSRPRKWCMG